MSFFRQLLLKTQTPSLGLQLLLFTYSLQTCGSKTADSEVMWRELLSDSDEENQQEVAHGGKTMT